MPATPTQTLFDESKCYTCYGDVSTAAALKLALLRRELIAINPMAATDPQTLFNSGKCYACFGPLASAQILELALLKATLTALNPAIDVSPQALVTYGKCYACPGASMFETMLLALLDLISQNEGGVAPPDPNNKLTLTDSGGVVTIISDPTGDYDFTAQDVASAVAFHCPHLTGLAFRNNPGLAVLILNNCPSFNEINLVGTSVASVDLTGTAANYEGISLEANTALTALNASTVQTSAVIFMTSNGALANLDFSSLSSVGGNLTVTFNAVLGSASFPMLANVSGTLDVEDNPALSVFGTDALVFCDEIYVSNNPSLLALSFPALTTVADLISVLSMLSLTTVGLPVLTAIVSPFEINGGPSLNSVNLSSVATIQANFSVKFCTALPSLALPALASSISGNVDARDNDNLATFSMNGQSWENNGENILFTNGSLDEATVDLILHAGVTGGMTSGTIDTSGGASAPPSIAGEADRALLILAGVTVTTN